MNKKLKLALKNSSSEQGFAIPIAVGLGFVMLLIGATMIMRSQGDEVTASTQKATNRGLSAAETGITRYQSLINSNRVIATYPLTGTLSWTEAKDIPGISTCNGSTVTGATVVKDAANTRWRDVNTEDLNGNETLDTGEDLNENKILDRDPSLGQYRIVNYTYSSTPTTFPGTGTLTVEGRVNQSGSGKTATTSLGTATTRLQVNIPVQQGDINSIPVPGLWLGTGTPGKNEIQGNVLLSDCNADPSKVNLSKDKSGNVLINPDTGQPYQALYSDIDFPDLPVKPSPSPNTLTLTDKSSLILPKIGTDKTSTKNGETVYEYSVANIPKGANITITPGQKVIFYLDGNIEKGADLTHTCPIDAKGIPLAGCVPNDFQIFGYSSKGTMCPNGTTTIEAFIYAPKYTAGVEGGAGGKGGFKGSVWVGDWDNGSGCGSATGNKVLVQNASWTTLGLTPKNLPPTLSGVSSWQRQEAK